MKKKLDAIVFDADGTLLDTREFIFSAYEHTLAIHNWPVPDRDTMRKSMGLALAECYRIFAPQGDNAAMCETHHVYQENNFALIDSYEGLVYTLDTLRGTGYKIGICSSRSGHLESALQHVGIRDHCDVIVGGNDVIHHKPDPEGILKVLTELAIEPARATMIGDSRQDIEAGKNAKVALTVGVTHGFGMREMLAEASADQVVDRLPEILPLFIEE